MGALENHVIVVTGAGRGIGREIALLAAAEGAKVVVNDLGGSAEGVGADAGPAAEVVEAIRGAGGEAVASVDSVSDPDGAEAIVQTALDAFGRLDAVVNNAGILRDGIFHRMSPEDFDAVVKVHLYGAFYVARAAAPLFREQQSGTFVHMTSTSGLIGNLGQANYAAAKLGIVGLSKSIALDMARFGVRSNCIAPFAWSRLVGTVPTDDPSQVERVARIKAMGPKQVATVAIYLASDLSAPTTGQIYAVRKNEVFLFGQPRPIRAMQRSNGWTPQSLAEELKPAFTSSHAPLERSQDVFNWDPV
jgi:NAD(P)-dependent dehydrogenase (short-subunit alcohol dehydrogenase family)